jgi:pantoate--beta-alanine ligase
MHEGHASLIRRARQENDIVAISVFVNPTQFGPEADFNKYPRDEEQDSRLAESLGVDIFFAPSVEEMYPHRATTVSVEGITNQWEGAVRPGHFQGVATVVCKLFNIVKPSWAYFGLKDLQQCAVLRTMVEDLNMDVELRLCPTIREPDGLALSSRNVFLSPEDRSLAPMIYRQLEQAAEKIRAATHADAIQSALDTSKQVLTDGGFDVDYFELVNNRTLALERSAIADTSIIAAAKLGFTRLIDNIQL